MELTNKQVVLAGLGRSSIGAAQLLRKHGARPFISEFQDGPRLREWLDRATEMDIPCEVGGHTAGAFEGADLIIVSPGVPLTAPCLRGPRLRNTPILGELELACRFSTSRILAVTGTNGKTTATTLLADMVRASGRTVALAGNNDTPFSLVALAENQPEYVVLEVSSFQLETTEQFHPEVAAVLNLSEDHLGRHGTMEDYLAAKARIFERQGQGDAAVLNADDPLVSAMALPDGVDRYAFSLKARAARTLYADDTAIYYEDEPIASMADNPLPGRHNLANVLASLTVMRAAGFAWDGPLAGLRSFRGVEHRIEHALHLNGVDYYNDSKSTNTDSLRVALESFTRPVVLIAGGRGKGGDYAVLNDLVREHVKHLILIGEDAGRMESAFAGLAVLSRADSMMDAVQAAKQHAEPGDVVLLSPACASFDMYENFEARGRDFKQCLAQLAPGLDREKENAQ